MIRREGFSPHSVEAVLRDDLEELGEAITVEDDPDAPLSGIVRLNGDPRFQSFVRDHIKSVVRILKNRAR